METTDIIIRKQMGGFAPDPYLSNMAIMYFEEPNLASKRLFPICQVDLPSGHYFEFNRADLARDGVRRKPDFGKVAPVVLGHVEQSYSCHIDQILIGVDQLLALSYQRAGIPEQIEPYRLRIKTITEQIALHQEIEFAQKFFRTGVWTNEWTGAASRDDSQKKFMKFDLPKCDPVLFIDEMIMSVRRQGRRKPNKLALGVDTFVALKNNPSIKERIKYSGTTSNPAVVTEQVLAQIFGLDLVVVLDATYNGAPHGAEDLQYVCDEKGALLLYAPDVPQIDSPSAGYIFAWNINEGDYITIDQFEGDGGTHSDFLEGLIAYDMRKTSDALGVYMTECCG